MIINKKENWYESLFDLFSGAYGITLTQTEISDIIHEVHEVSEQSLETGQVDAIVKLLENPTETDSYNAALGFDHSLGLKSDEEIDYAKFEAKEYARAWAHVLRTKAT